ncbi:phosphatidylinositol glycan, class C [Angomonas deanei]|nr:phosphatidylinositol glycan, class C [Angomonas deanei]|eukprot:EPY40628.1 phosphatidylinositol glycan, class C [Angomonas deanei]
MEQNPFPMGSPVMARDMSGFPVGSPTQVVRSWRRVLYEKQPFEDNFVDTSLFMNELRQNENVHVHKYSDVMFATFPIAQQVACIVLFTKVFYSMLDREYSAVSLIGADATILLISWVVFVYMHFEDMMREDASFRQSGLRVKLVRILLIMFQFGRQLVALTSTLILLAPIITTLTATFTDDTIMAFSISAMFLNVILADYRYLSALTNRYQPNTSVNSAFFAVTMMASRFRSPLDGGAIMAFRCHCVRSFSPSEALHQQNIEKVGGDSYAPVFPRLDVADEEYEVAPSLARHWAVCGHVCAALLLCSTTQCEEPN